jgi:hypothetical protein
MKERERVDTYITRPMGKTKPLRTLTSPGLEAVSEGEPADTISERRFPKERSTPAIN